MSNAVRKVIIVILCVWGWSARGEYAPNYAPQFAIDRLVFRLHSRYRTALPTAVFSQPINAADIRQILAPTDSLDSLGMLLPGERDECRRLSRIVSGRSALLSWNSTRFRDVEGHVHLEFHWHVSPWYAIQGGDDSLFAGGWLGAGISGGVGTMSYYSGLEVGTEYRSEPFPASSFQPYEGVPYTLYGREDTSHVRATDMVRGGLQYIGKRILVEVALDRLKLGPVVYSPLVLSGAAPPIMFLRTRWDLGMVHYMHLAGLLRSQKDRSKYIYLHRVDIPVKSMFLNLGVSEVVITGSTTDQEIDSLRPVYYPHMTREPEPVYLLPFVPFTMAEHYLGDRDNSGLSLDINLSWPRSWRWYAEFFLDDMTAPWTLFTDDWGNKWAVAAGVQYFGAVRDRALTVTFEYARVEPWVYTHFYGGSHNFTHFGQCLGAPLGPNSAAIHLGFDFALAPHHSVGLLCTNERRNPTARGGSITDIFQDTAYGYVPRYPDSWTKSFLGPGTEPVTRVGAIYRLTPFGWFRLDAEAGVEMDSRGNRLYAVLHGRWVW